VLHGEADMKNNSEQCICFKFHCKEKQQSYALNKVYVKQIYSPGSFEMDITCISQTQK
jgi:hypothetical protein